MGWIVIVAVVNPFHSEYGNPPVSFWYEKESDAEKFASDMNADVDFCAAVRPEII